MEMLSIVLGALLVAASCGCSSPRKVWSQDGYGFSGLLDACPLGEDVVMEGIINIPTAGVNYGTRKFSGACWGGGVMWFSPRDPNIILGFEPRTNATVRIDIVATAANFIGCATTHRGETVVFVPHHGMSLLILNTTSRRFRLISNFPADIDKATASKFIGAVSINDDVVYLGPHSSIMPLVAVTIRPEGVSMRTFDWRPPGITALSNAFTGIIADHRSLWLVPHYCSAIVRFFLSNSSSVGYDRWPPGIVSAEGSYAGGTFDGANFVYFPPFLADHLLRVSVHDGSMTSFLNFPNEVRMGTNKFIGAIFDGRHIYMSPRSATHVVRFDPVTETMTAFNMWPPGFQTTGFKFDGISFDGESLYLVPLDNAIAVRVRRRDPWPATASNSLSRTATTTDYLSETLASVATMSTSLTPSSSESFSVLASATPTPRFSPTTSASPVGIHSTMTTTLAHSPTLATVAPRGTVVITVERDALSTALGGAGVPAASASTATTVVVGAFVSPTGSTRIPRVAAATSLLRCGLATDDAAAADAKPSLLELPAHPAVGNSARRYYAGGALLAAAGVVAAKLSAVLLSRSVANGVVRVLAAIAAALEAFFAANVCFGAVSVLAQTPDTAGAAAAAVSLILAGGAIGASVWCVNSTSETVNEAVWRPFIEGCRDRRRAAARNFYAAEQLASCAMAAVSAAAGAPSAPCSWMAALLILLMAAYVLYLLLALPYASRVDMTFALLLGALQLALGVTALLQLRGIVGAAVVGWMAIAAYGTSLAQTVVQAAVALWLSERRRTSLDSDTPMLIMSDAEEPTSSSSGSAAAAPVAVPSPVSNPLHHHHHHHHQ